MESHGAEKRIRELFAEMRREDERAAPPFSLHWQKVQHPASELPHRRPRLRFAIVAGLCIAALAAFIFSKKHANHQLPSKSAQPMAVAPQTATAEPVAPTIKGQSSPKPVKQKRAPAHGSRATMSISAWQSPTASLLRSPSGELLSTLPQLDEFLQKPK